jgi:hypothetical protein
MKIKSKRKAGETGSTNCGSETSLMGFAEAYLTETKNAAPGRVGLKTRYWAEKISGEKSFGAFLRVDRNQEKSPREMEHRPGARKSNRSEIKDRLMALACGT